ncbi:MAG: sugar phosphate isomerase/epimerase family protein, partial [Thermacetogeniaceae bacterium]
MIKLGAGAYRERFQKEWDFCVSHFDVLELQDFIMPENLENPAVIDGYRAMLKDFSGEVTVHGPYINLVPTSIDKKIREVAELRYLQGVEAAEKLGARKMVIHSFYDLKSGYSGYDEFWLEENLKFWSRFLEKIEGSGITILLENCYDQQPEVFGRLISGIGSLLFGSCLDLGHCN